MGLVSGRSMHFKVSAGDRPDVPILLLSKEIHQGAGSPISEGWMQRAVVAAVDGPVEWELPLPPAADGATMILLVATPQIDTDLDGVPDGVEALILSSDWTKPPFAGEDVSESVKISESGLSATFEAAQLQRIMAASHRVYGPPPAFTVNGNQEQVVQEHVHRGAGLRRLGLKSVAELSPAQALSIESKIGGKETVE